MFKVQSSKLIEIEHLSAGYEGKEVLHDINLTVYKDDYLGIIGPNGGGKTTLMRLILGLMKPTDGSIRFYKDGEEVREISMGYLPCPHDILSFLTQKSLLTFVSCSPLQPLRAQPLVCIILGQKGKYS
mgnify:CR=1 FL=1